MIEETIVAEEDRSRLTTLIALVVIGVRFDDAKALEANGEADALLAAWRSVNKTKAN
jgi:hypothetical protein